MGDAYTRSFPEKCQSRSPVRASRAKIIPSVVPPNTRFPAVDITPPQGGEMTLCSHLMRPEKGSIATTFPQLSSGAKRAARGLRLAAPFGGRFPPAPKIPVACGAFRALGGAP